MSIAQKIEVPAFPEPMLNSGLDLRRYAAGRELQALMSDLREVSHNYPGADVRKILGNNRRRSLGISVLTKSEVVMRPWARRVTAETARAALIGKVATLQEDFPFTAVRVAAATNEEKGENFVIAKLESEETLDIEDERYKIDECLNGIVGPSSIWNDPFRLDMTLAYVPDSEYRDEATTELVNTIREHMPLPLTLLAPSLK